MDPDSTAFVVRSTFVDPPQQIGQPISTDSDETGVQLEGPCDALRVMGDDGYVMSS